MLKYKDSLGSAEYSAADEWFIEKTIGLSDLVTFEGESVKTLKEAFAEAVDDYVSMCEQAGENPKQS